MNLPVRRVLGALAIPILLALAGCGGGKPAAFVEGRLLDNGNPMKITPTPGLPPGDKGFRLTFVELGKDAETAQHFDAVVNEDGTFRVGGQKDPGLPPGKYRVAVIKGGFGMPDQFGDAFSHDKSPITIDIPNAKSVKVDVDIGKRSATVVQ